MERVPSRDGTPIAFQRRGTGPPLVLVHGMASDHTRWNPLLEYLEEHFTVYAMDRRGRGESGDADEFSFGREVEDVAALANSPGRPVNLYGHSYGAICALDAALKIPQLRRLVLYEPCTPNDPDCIDRIQNLIDQGNLEEALRTFLRDVALMSPDEIDAFRARPTWPARVATVHTLAREMRAENEFRIDHRRLQDLRVPTLLLLGADSPPEVTAPTESVHAALPDSRIHLLPGQQHMADSAAPEQVSRALISFLSEQ